MAASEIPANIRAFIYKYVDSVELLNVLLLLQSNPTKLWSVREITQELRSSNGSIEKRLNDLYHRQVLGRAGQEQGGHRFDPLNEEFRDMVNQLADFYRSRPTTVIEAIYARPDEALKAFADAFKFKGEK